MNAQEFGDALKKARTHEEINQLFELYRRESIARPYEQLELFPDTYTQTQRQREATADPLRWVEVRGLYAPTGSALLMARARRYADNHRDRLRGILKKARLTETEQTDILRDYAAAAQGVTHYTAAPSLMAKALRMLPPRACYTEDRFLFYDMVFNGYRERVQALARYDEAKDADIMQKIMYLQPFAPLPYADAVAWGVNFEFIDLSEFAEVEAVTDDADPLTFAGSARVSGDWWKYYRFVWFVQQALLATAEDVEQIIKPPFPTETEERDKLLKTVTAVLTEFEAADKLTADELTKEGIQGTLSRQLSTIAAGGVIGYKLPDTDTQGDNLLSLLKVKQERGEVTKIMYETVEKVINGVNYMFAQGGYKEAEGFFSMYTNPSKFADYCGIDNSNSETRKRLLKATAFLHGIQYSSGSNRFLPILFIERDTDKYKEKVLQILLPPEYLRGNNRIFATVPQLNALRGASRGAQARFINLLMTREHKSEDEILRQIYNYDAEMMEAHRVGGTEATERYKRTWVTNKTRRRKQLAKWFKEARDKGVVLSYEYKKGTHGMVYSWKTTDNMQYATDTDTDTDTSAQDGTRDVKTVRSRKTKKRKYAKKK